VSTSRTPANHRQVVAFWLALASAVLVCGRWSAAPGPVTAGTADPGRDRLLAQALRSW
jgi:hypothetical protein